MKIHRRIVLVLLVLLVPIGLIAFAAATPGSDQDPLVTFSYVEKRIVALQVELRTEIEALKKSLTASTSQPPVSDGSTAVATYESTTLPAGAQLLLGKGTELVLRRGEALVLDPTGNALPDLTEGIDLAAGTTVPKNHLLLCPKEDGRGIQATSTITVMIKGNYQILQPPKE